MARTHHAPRAPGAHNPALRSPRQVYLPWVARTGLRCAHLTWTRERPCPPLPPFAHPPLPRGPLTPHAQVYLPWAARTGLRCADLMCIYYERHLDEDLDELRCRWRVVPAPPPPLHLVPKPARP